MEYRIRYRSGDSGEQAETVVEAHNTAEAVVKFFHAHGRMRDTTPGRQTITSISQEAPVESIGSVAASDAMPY